MDTQHLEERFHELIEHLESNGYSKGYIRKIRTEFNWIVSHSEDNEWGSYEDVYRERSASTSSENVRRTRRNAIAALERFDLHGILPDGIRRESSVTARGAYHLLLPQYKALIDHYRQVEAKRGRRESSIHHEASNASCFLYAMQLRGCTSLDQITEEDAISFFRSPDGESARGCSYRKSVTAVLKAGTSRDEECARVLLCLPMLREKRKNIQYLTPEEFADTKAFLTNDDSGLSLRDRAIGLLLLFTALRGCDVASMRVDSINWQDEVMTLRQQKTDAPLELPLLPIVGNAIYDYITEERPPSPEPWIFLGESRPHQRLQDKSVGNVVAKIFRLMGIRQREGDRKGTHIFRHNAASTMLSNGVARPVISQTLGHTDPESLDPYLRADFPHLKECALSIEAFPVPEEVFVRW